METYTCAHCHGTFETGWTDIEAAAEFAVEFPSHQDAATETICDDCYKLFMGWVDETGQQR